MKTVDQVANEVLDAMLVKAKGWEARRAVDGFAEIRGWGTWENPDDTPDDEAEDYDWQVLSNKSADTLTEIKVAMTLKHPEFTISINAEEKNWICIKVTK